MRQHIFRSVMVVIGLLLLLVVGSMAYVLQGQLTRTTYDNLRHQGQLLQHMPHQEVQTVLARMERNDVRATLIDRDGTVLYDTIGKPLENHLARQEVVAALATGEGQAHRVSQTVGMDTYYYALRLDDGSVLRLSLESSWLWHVAEPILYVLLGLVVLALVLGYGMARYVTQRIVGPINDVDLRHPTSVPYEELAPFVHTILSQGEEIQSHVAALEERSHTIDTLMNSMEEGLILTDEAGLVMALNHSVRQSFSLKAALGRPIEEVLKGFGCEEALQEGRQGERRETVFHYEGRTYTMLVTPVEGVGLILLFMDRTDSLEGERRRREFSANVSHELKTPLTSIYGNVELLQHGMVKSGDEPIFYDRILKETEKLIHLIEDILKMSRLDEEGTTAVVREPISLSQIVRDVVDTVKPKGDDRYVQWHLEVPEEPVVVCGHSTQLYEMVLNLVDNAVKYNRPHGAVRIVLQDVDGRVTLAVSDTGIGIPRSEHGRIFERFYRVENSRSSETGGTGLGLAIVKHIVLNHGGQLELHSEEGQGTTITVTLPMNGAAATIP